MSKQETLVLIPAWGMRHLIPMTQLAKLLTTTTTFSVAIVIFQSPNNVTSTVDPFVARVTSTHPSISFHTLPQPSLPPNLLSNGRKPFPFEHLRFSNPQLTPFLASLSETSHIRALILDMFCTASLDVARDLHIPAYIFYSCSSFILASFSSLPGIESRTKTGLKELGKAPLPLPCLPPIPASYLPKTVLDRKNEGGQLFMYHCERLVKADGIIVNSFEAMEPRVVKAVGDGLFGPIPPIYCIGPLINDADGTQVGEKHECLKWLDEQPKGSVVFLCFGSMGSFSVGRLKEIAIGLEKSEQRFLWVVKAPPTGHNRRENKVGMEKNWDADLEKLLPEGFLGRTKGRGMVVKSWVPQAAVLGHEAVGGFVSHCGWNSTLEAVSAGVAMIAWPLFGEQKMNKVFLVEEAKVAVEMEGTDEEMVKAEEVEKKVRWLMESEGGKELKERMRVMKESALRARMKGGPSDQAWMKFVNGLICEEYRACMV